MLSKQAEKGQGKLKPTWSQTWQEMWSEIREASANMSVATGKLRKIRTHNQMEQAPQWWRTWNSSLQGLWASETQGMLKSKEYIPSVKQTDIGTTFNRPEMKQPWVVKELGNITLRTLVIFFERAQWWREVPDAWKKASITPMFQKGKKRRSRELQASQPHLCS